MILHLAPTCYLCGESPSEHADHVIPKAAGGSDTLANLGAACAPCNLSKGDTNLTPTREQQHAIRSALDAITVDPVPFWLDFFSEDIELAVGDLIEDFEDEPEIIDHSDAVDYLGLESVIESFPLAFPSVVNAAADVVLASFREQVAGDPE